MDSINPTREKDRPMDGPEFARMVKAAFGSAVKRRRKEIGITQDILALRSQLHRTYIADIERGARNLSLVNIVKLANALSISIAQLCGAMEESYKQLSSGSAPSPPPRQ